MSQLAVSYEALSRRQGCGEHARIEFRAISSVSAAPGSFDPVVDQLATKWWMISLASFSWYTIAAISFSVEGADLFLWLVIECGQLVHKWNSLIATFHLLRSRMCHSRQGSGRAINSQCGKLGCWWQLVWHRPPGLGLQDMSLLPPMSLLMACWGSSWSLSVSCLDPTSCCSFWFHQLVLRRLEQQWCLHCKDLGWALFLRSWAERYGSAGASGTIRLRVVRRMATAVFQLRRIVVHGYMIRVEDGSSPGCGISIFLLNGGGHDFLQLKHPMVALYCSSEFPISKFRQSNLCQRNHKTMQWSGLAS